MKKILVVLSLVCFIGVNISTAGNPPVATQETKKEVVTAKADATPAPAMKCCVKANAACCKSSTASKVCTPEQKASCAKMGETKAEAKPASKEETKSGSN
jgi:hypothetical protein